jgi:hypothetical protein
MSRQRTHIILVVIRGTAIRITPPLTISEEEIEKVVYNAEVMMKFIIESNFQGPAIRYNLYGERRHKRIFTAIGAKRSR